MIGVATVYLHLHRSSPTFVHTGLSVCDDTTCVRYDFRAFNDGYTYETRTDMLNDNAYLFPRLPEIVRQHLATPTNDVKTIRLGETRRTIPEVVVFERTLHRRYILGWYDCRHHSNALCKFCLNKTIPLWDLNRLFSESFDEV